MGIFGARGSSGMSPRDRRALQRAAVASKFLSAAVPTDSVASATTVNLNYTTGELVEITGTTTITGFTEANDVGEWRFVIFEGALILTHNATSFILPGGGNITTAAGDTAEFYHLGDGYWQCVRYTRGGVPPTPGAAKTANVRLTLESGVPISVTDQSAKSILYATPFMGNFMPFYNGTNWADVTFSELSIPSTTTTNATTTNGSPVVNGISSTAQFAVGMVVLSANINSLIISIDSATQVTCGGNATGTGTASTQFYCNITTGPYDVFAVLISGTPALRFSRVWASATARTDAISLLNGIYVNTNALTGSGNTTIAANQATFLGTMTTDGTGLMYDTFGKRHVWNMFNRRLRPQYATEATDTWNYSTAAYRAANNNGTTNSIVFVRGLNEDMVRCDAYSIVINSTATARSVRIGIGLDSTTVNSATVYDDKSITSASYERGYLHAAYIGYPGLGTRSLTWLEYGAGADTQTWSGDAGGIRQTGIIGEIWA